MFGSKALALPSPFPHDHRPQYLYSEPARPQPSGQCHFLVSHASSKEQRCPCQGYQHNRNTHGSVCDCAHAACYHSQNVHHGSPTLHESPMSSGTLSATLLDRIRKLEEALQAEREIRESVIARERQSWEREIRVLREALTPFYKSEQDMQDKLTDIEDKLDGILKEQSRLKSRVSSVEDVGMPPNGYIQNQHASAFQADLRAHSTVNGLGPHDAPVVYSGSEDRTSVSAEPMSPRPPTNVAAEPESPRSSGILNLVQFPRPVVPRYTTTIPTRLSPPVEAEEPRSSGFLGVDVKDLIQRRKLARGGPPAHGYISPSSSANKSPSTFDNRTATPQTLYRVSPPNMHLNGSLTDIEDRAYKKRKHQTELMALDVLADVSAASPVIS